MELVLPFSTEIWPITLLEKGMASHNNSALLHRALRDALIFFDITLSLKIIHAFNLSSGTFYRLEYKEQLIYSGRYLQCHTLWQVWGFPNFLLKLKDHHLWLLMGTSCLSTPQSFADYHWGPLTSRNSLLFSFLSPFVTISNKLKSWNICLFTTKCFSNDIEKFYPCRKVFT